MESLLWYNLGKRMLCSYSRNCIGFPDHPAVWSIVGATTRTRVAVSRSRMRLTMLRVRVRIAARVSPSVGNASKRKAWQPSRKFKSNINSIKPNIFLRNEKSARIG